MGGIVKAVTNVVKSVFGGGGGGQAAVAPVTSAPVQQVSARDLVASTSSSDPNAATMGSDSKKQKNKRGKSSLMVAKDKPTGSSSNTGLNI